MSLPRVSLEVDVTEAEPFLQDSISVSDSNIDPEAKADDEGTDAFAEDPFKPFDDLPNEDRNPLTVRAVVLGLFCGTLVNASNIYLGLKSGWTASANIFASIIGFTVLQTCAKHASHFPIIGGDFGPRENNIVQTCATAAGGMSNVFVSAYPALYQLGLLRTPVEDFWRITTLTAVGGFFGFFFATPLRQFFIIDVARELHLVFPSSSATAVMIRNLHTTTEGQSSTTQSKMKALTVAFGFAMTLRILSQYAIGVLWDWHPFTWLFILGKVKSAIVIESWGWFIEWTPAFIGSGMLVGLNIAVSYVAGSIAAWGIIGPLLVSRGLAFGQPALDRGPTWDGFVSYYSLDEGFASPSHPSPRYWLMWPGILCMVVVALIDLACQWRVFYLSAWTTYKQLRRFLNRQSQHSQLQTATSEEKLDLKLEDTAPASEFVPAWLWFSGLICVCIAACIATSVQFSMPILETCLALLLTVFFSFLAIQSTGVADITPVTGVSSASQIVLGGVTKSSGLSVPQSQITNLLGGAFTNIGASQATDLIGDFRVGFLLRTSPLKQWMAQGIGTLAAVFLSPLIFVLFSSAYPCIIDLSHQSTLQSSPSRSSSSAPCPFQAPSASAWRAVAIAVTAPTLPVPPSSRAFALFLAFVGAALVLVRQLLWTGRWAWLRTYHPNMMVFSLAFVIPSTVYGTAMLIGALVAATWARRSPRTFETYGYAVSAGLMAGEGIGGVLSAVLQVLGLGGDVWGTGAGCPGWRC
ncbi:hypothetical protein MMC30_009033 [Trapelia coarctata]|nr:hypothetical protein [Trapelia coarctata]